MLFDIVFISYQESNADANWEALRARFPYARRLHGISGIHQAHQQAAKIVATDYFWVVDGDSTVVDDFNFTPPKLIDQYRKDKIDNAVYVYRATNPVNNLSYGYGGIKLLPRESTRVMSTNNIDMTTSISEHFCPIDVVASITNFNTDPFSTWRSAFRECVKLSGRTIDNQVDDETQQRLDTWCTLNDDVSYGYYAYAGALAGREYGTNNKDDATALKKINDFVWLKKQYDIQTYTNKTL